jgi:hypothetical protein
MKPVLPQRARLQPRGPHDYRGDDALPCRAGPDGVARLCGRQHLNSTGDMLATIVGFVCASRFSFKVVVAMFVVVEVGLLLTIRDNLTLKVLMLFLPVESIKQ